MTADENDLFLPLWLSNVRSSVIMDESRSEYFNSAPKVKLYIVPQLSKCLKFKAILED